MSGTETTDVLAEVLRNIESWCSKQKVKFIFGHLEEERGLPVVQLENQGSTPNDDFLELLNRLDPAAVVIPFLLQAILCGLGLFRTVALHQGLIMSSGKTGPAFVH